MYQLFSQKKSIIWAHKLTLAKNHLSVIIAPMLFLQYESLGDEIKYITEKRPWYKNDIVMGFLQYESLGDEIKGYAEKMPWYKNYTLIIFGQYESFMCRDN